MDPTTRRKLWGVIVEMKRGKTIEFEKKSMRDLSWIFDIHSKSTPDRAIILTTHSMEEAGPFQFSFC
jgi:ABC-type multidrug transport system ATPase subunit